MGPTDPPAIRLAKLAIVYEKAHGVFFPSSAEEMAELGSQVLLAAGMRYFLSIDGRSIICAKCRNMSNNPNDVENRYCGACHEFLDGKGEPR